MKPNREGILFRMNKYIVTNNFMAAKMKAHKKNIMDEINLLLRAKWAATNRECMKKLKYGKSKNLG